jgi:hypothetical protein
MNAKQAREMFDAAIKAHSDQNAIARLELAREFFCNPAFRKTLEQKVWEINTKTA